MEDLWNTLKKSPEKLNELILHKDLTEEMAIYIAENRNTPPECLAMLATSNRFKDSYKLKLSLCKNPKTPQRITLSLLKFLRLFDLADLTKNQNIHINIRQKIEQMLKEKIPSLPLGNRITLAKRSSGNVILSILENAKGGKEVSRLINTCLENPLLTEGDVLKLINRETTPPNVIQAIAIHPRWSTRYSIKYALIRNFYTPLGIVVELLRDMKLEDLQELYNDEAVPSSSKPFIYHEITQRLEKA